MNASSTPAAASQSSGPASGRKPISTATPKTSTVEAALRATLAATWPASTAAPPTSIERRRSMIPPVMSWLTVTAVVADAEARAQQDDAGHDVGDVLRADLDRAAEQLDEDRASA